MTTAKLKVSASVGPYVSRRIVDAEFKYGDNPVCWQVVHEATGKVARTFYEYYNPEIPGASNKNTAQQFSIDTAAEMNQAYRNNIKAEKERKKRVAKLRAVIGEIENDREIIEAFMTEVTPQTMLEIALAVADKNAARATKPADMNRLAEIANQISWTLANIRQTFGDCCF